MPWGRCDDSHYDHDKVLSMPVTIRNAADGLYWRAISYCNAKLTDGFVSRSVVEHLNGTPEQVAALVKSKLWHRVRGGYRVHDFLDFNKSRAEVEEERARKAEAGRAGGLASGRARRGGKQEGSNNEAGASGVLELPSRPVPSDSTQGSTEALGAVGAPPAALSLSGDAA